MLSKSFYPLSPVIDEAFGTSKTLVEEVDLDEMDNPATMMGLVGKAMLPDGQTLDQVVSKDTYAAVRTTGGCAWAADADAAADEALDGGRGVDAAEISKAGFDSKLGIDQHFFEKAKAIGMPRRALETVAYQFDRLDGLAATLQEASLKAMLADIDTQARNIETMASAWRAGDTATMERLLMEGFARRRRNRRAASLRAQPQLGGAGRALPRRQCPLLRRRRRGAPGRARQPGGTAARPQAHRGTAVAAGPVTAARRGAGGAHRRRILATSERHGQPSTWSFTRPIACMKA